MRTTSLMPWNWNALGVRRGEEDPFAAMQREMNRAFENFFQGEEGGLSTQLAGVTPKLDVSETDTEVHISAELPGMKEEDIDVELAGDTLRISGEKRDEREEKQHNFHRVERSFGRFERVVPLPADVDRDKVAATFKNGVLTITAPKAVKAPPTQKISVKTEG